MSAIATAAKVALGRDDLHAIADKSYFSGTEIQACHTAGITTTVPRAAISGNESKSMFVKADSVLSDRFELVAARTERCPTCHAEAVPLCKSGSAVLPEAGPREEAAR